MNPFVQKRHNIKIDANCQYFNLLQFHFKYS